MEFTRIDEDTRREVLEFWERKFGVPPDTFDDYRFFMKGRNKVWISGTEHLDLTLEAIGLPFLRVNQEHPKPTTDALQRFGEHVSKNAVDVTAEEARTFVSGETVEREYDVDLGYVAVRYDGDVLGCGLYFPGELRSQVPKGRRVDLALPDTA